MFFNETSDPPEIIDIFGFSIDPLGAEHCLFLFGILILLESLLLLYLNQQHCRFSEFSKFFKQRII